MGGYPLTSSQPPTGPPGAHGEQSPTDAEAAETGTGKPPTDGRPNSPASESGSSEEPSCGPDGTTDQTSTTSPGLFTARPDERFQDVIDNHVNLPILDVRDAIMGAYFFCRAGCRISAEQFHRLSRRDGYWRLACSAIVVPTTRDGHTVMVSTFTVSTIWQGTDPVAEVTGRRPMIFSTAVHNLTNGDLASADEPFRDATETDAYRRHNRVTRTVADSVSPTAVIEPVTFEPPRPMLTDPVKV